MGHFFDTNPLFYLSKTSFLGSIWFLGVSWAQIWVRGWGCHRDTYCIKRIKVRVGWDHSKWKISSKLSQYDECQTKTWSHQILSNFGHHALHPFNMKHRAKTAVKFSILRVVMLWSSKARILWLERQVTYSSLEASHWTSQWPTYSSIASHQVAIEDC